MSSTTSAKRIKFVKENEFKNKIAESGFHSEIDLSSNTSNDFSLPAVKRKSLVPRRTSLQQISLNLTSENTQQSSGYSSLYSSSSNITTTGSISSLGRTSRTPKKRKSEVTESDENFYNSFQFVSPVKIRRRDVDDKNCAKLVLKEKCSSENVILCSTPIRTQNTKWGKFRSFHPEKLQSGKNLDNAELTEKLICTPPIKSLAEDSINLSNIDFSNLSGNFTNSNIQQDIPANLHNLWTDDIKQSNSVSLSACISTSESQVKSVQSTFSSSSNNSSKSIERRNFFNGRAKFDILGTLHSNNDIALKEILSFMDAASLVSLSHVCKDYSNMIKDNKLYNTKRNNYLKKCREIKENKVPSKRKALNFTIENDNINESSIREKKKKKAFGHYNINLSQVTKQKTPSPPQSPSSRRFNEFQKLIQSNKTSTFKRCPRCRKPATISTIKIRNSPRKKKTSSILKLSTSTGRVQKRFRTTFLSKTSIPESFHEALNPHYVTLSHIDEDSSRSPQRSSSCDSPNSSGSDESCEIDEIYEYGICTGAGCSFKFCVKCNCKYHPRRICGDLSPPSPSHNQSKTVAGTKASRKSLRRLNY
ncbi:serine-rich adhesin for platelets-like [Chironomus tepperi]|uniref:serine-rich adhesin for platelets-like n=1 Tax=Chironomus tepperi TaxID=113505 RepID=UPI00391F6931